MRGECSPDIDDEEEKTTHTDCFAADDEKNE